MKIVFIADAHLKGLGDPNQESLVKFLDGLSGVDKLVILGDLFDFWTGFNEVVYYHYLPVLTSLMGLKGRGTEIVYLEGNHDFSMGGFFTGNLGASVCPEHCELEVEGRSFYLAHGDTVRMSAGYRLWRGFLRSGVFRLITRVTPPGVVWKVAGFLSGRSRKYNKRGSFIDRRFEKFAEHRIAGGADCVVLGHSHVPGVHEETTGGRRGLYANPGSWLDSSYLVYDMGEFRVERFEGQVSSG